MKAPRAMGFHEATVVRFGRYGSALELELEDVLVDGQKSRVALTVSPVYGVIADGEPSNASLMEANDGEVLTLNVSEGTLSLIIEWNDFSHRKSFTRSYRILGGNVSVSVI